MTIDVAGLRAREFPWAAEGKAIYLNHASTGPLPARALHALNEFNALRAEPFRLSDDLQFATLRRTRELVARLIHASSDEIACMGNTTYGINLAARALPLASGDVVVTFDREFPANVYPWMALRARGVTLERIPCLPGGLPDEARLLEALERPRVRAAAISWVQFSTGYRTDLEAIGRACHERGKFFVVDAIQGLGAATLDVHAAQIDVLACGAQKWLLAPWGAGFAYVRRELAVTLEPSVVGWLAMRASEDFTRLVDYEFAYHQDARRFEVITLPFQDFAGFNASLELFHELGPREVEHRVASLAQAIVDWCADRDDVQLVTPADPAHRAGIVSLAPRDPAAASARLARAGVAHALREGAIRLAPHCYNTESEIARALAVLGGADG